jgi:hypothetical protein
MMVSMLDAGYIYLNSTGSQTFLPDAGVNAAMIQAQYFRPETKNYL